MAVIDVVYHHGGEFVIKENGEMVYEMEAIDVEEKIDVDTLDVFSMRNHYMALGYEKIEKCWWVIPNRPLRTGRRVLGTDGELLELVFHAQKNGNKIHLYYEHVVSVPKLVEESYVPTNANPTKPNPHKKTTAKPTVKKTTKPTTKPNVVRPNVVKPNLVKPQTRSATRVSPRKAKKVVENPVSEDDGSSSHDSYDSVEDNLYVLRADELSSDSEDEDEIRITQARKKDSNRRQRAAMDMKKAREEIMLEDDGLVVDSDSDSDLGMGFVKDANVAKEHEEYDAYDVLAHELWLLDRELQPEPWLVFTCISATTPLDGKLSKKPTLEFAN
ncbi:hypothetical protein PIB30_002466 [Stylosanthes scabra]|uniref:PB1-like domain-containing protein n=1 Tax=Stylosanthes scabra TaxID=79078 RepID=A0ABU6X0K7_9FABA|nr:hypothetical protein [Stylosanthes scabra]